SANCCAGPTTGYSVHVGRSESLTGPYVDREGVPLLQSRAGGTPGLAPKGNGWVGTGHNAIVTGLGGREGMACHALARDGPYLDATEGGDGRPMLCDRLAWVAGWPPGRAGAWGWQARGPGPVSGGRARTDCSEGIGRTWHREGRWTTAVE